ncbi:MAG TPA: hypothetical protein VGE18_01565 [Candidatus Paceibacterota bacterium]
MSNHGLELKRLRVGDSIYVPPVLSREEPRSGGKATVKELFSGENGNGETIYFTTEQFPQERHAYDWEKVSRVQELLATRFGEEEARFITTGE